MSDSYVARVDGNHVRVHSISGSVKTSIACGIHGGPVYAVVSGDEVHIQCGDGTVRIYSISGNFKRTIC